MITPIIGSAASGSAPSTTVTSYNYLFHGSAWNTTASVRTNKISIAGVISDFYVTLTTAPGVGNSFTFTIEHNGSTAGKPTLTISDANTTATAVGTLTVAAGDSVKVICTLTGTPTTSGITHWGAKFTGSVSGESFVVTASPNAATGSATVYLALMGEALASVTTEVGAQTIMPTAGTIDQLYFQALATPTTTATMTLYKNGSPTSLTASLSSATTATDLSDSVSFVAGDTLSWQFVNGSTGIRPVIAARIRPTVDGESLSLIAGNQALTQANTGYRYPGTGTTNSWTSENVRQLRVPFSFDIKKFYVGTSGSNVAVGNTVVGALRVNTADSALLATVTAGTSTANDTADTVSVVAGDLIAARITNSATTGTTQPQVSMVYYIAPPTPPATSSRRLIYFPGKRLLLRTIYS